MVCAQTSAALQMWYFTSIKHQKLSNLQIVLPVNQFADKLGLLSKCVHTATLMTLTTLNILISLQAATFSYPHIHYLCQGLTEAIFNSIPFHFTILTAVFTLAVFMGMWAFSYPIQRHGKACDWKYWIVAPDIYIWNKLLSLHATICPLGSLDYDQHGQREEEGIPSATTRCWWTSTTASHTKLSP